ncbi:hypothetical protein ACIQWR_07865 [Streptomyces sp. NPDC098789]|uniref:hypothetical protein n=1 Tax=Streptomyces sp. NPDC098789 TaxID=3366098 RepID=UPI003814DF1E
MAQDLRDPADLLLDALEPLAYRARTRSFVARAREMGPERAAALAATLDRRGTYERSLGVLAAAVAGDTAWIAARLADPDAVVRGQALAVAARVDDEDFAAALDDAPAAVRGQLLRAVVAGHRTALADRLVDAVRADWGDAEAAVLLPGCGAATVERLLPAVSYAVKSWGHLARRHPDLLADALDGELRALPEALRVDWWYRRASAVEALAVARPLRVLDLLERGAANGLPRPLHRLAARLSHADPDRTLRILITPSGDLLPESVAGRPAVLARLARGASPRTLLALGKVLHRHRAHPGQFARLTAALPPGRRAAFVDAVRGGRADEAAGGADARIDTELLAALPRAAAAAEARRTIGAARERGEGASALRLAVAHLPPTEARPELLAATTGPVAHDRAVGWRLLIANAGRSGDPGAVLLVLAEMARLRSEQDPVRTAALGALADVRPALLGDEAAPHLERIARDAVEARDCSHSTRDALTRTALGVLREHASAADSALRAWALRTVVDDFGRTHHLALGRLDQALGHGQERPLYEALRPWFETCAGQGEFRPVVAFAHALGRRAAELPALQQLLAAAVHRGRPSTARAAVALWLAPRAHRGARVEELLAADPSAVSLSQVAHVVTHQRTDLLGALIGERPAGRFHDASQRPRPFLSGVHRWTGRQQGRVAEVLAAECADTTLSLSSRAFAVDAVARVPGRGLAVVRAATADPEVLIAEAALAALVWTDRPGETLPELLAHAGGDRARVAVYAATRASRYVSPTGLEGVLGALTAPGAAKVTSRKEAVRLAAVRLRRPRVAAVLAEAFAAPGQHPDVRAACVPFAAPLIGDERAARLLAAAAQGGPAERAAVLRVAPTELPEAARAPYARIVLAGSAGAEPEEVAAACRSLASWLPWAPDEVVEALLAVAVDLGARRGWSAAADVLADAATSSPQAGRGVRRAIDALIAADRRSVDGPDDAGALRDRPALRRITHLATRLAAPLDRVRHGDGAPRAVVAEVVAALTAYDATTAAGIRLSARAFEPALPREELYDFLLLLAGAHAGRPGLVRSTTDALRAAALTEDGGTPEALHAVAGRLAATGDRTEGLFAVALLTAAGLRAHWPAAHRDLLRTLRRHPEPDVRDAALDRTTG